MPAELYKSSPKYFILFIYLFIYLTQKLFKGEKKTYQRADAHVSQDGG